MGGPSPTPGVPAVVPQVGDRHELRIRDLGFGGAGVAEMPSGVRCRVPKSLPGERVLAEVARTTPRALTLRLLRVLEPSPLRVPAPCRHFDRCGGCALQHLAYPEQLAGKAARLRERVARALGDAAAALVEAPVAAPAPLGYRNRNHFTVAGSRVGFVAPMEREVLDVERCPLATSATDGVLSELRRWLAGCPGAAGLGLLGATVRTGPGHPMLLLALDSGFVDVPALSQLKLGAPPPRLRPLLALLDALAGVSVWAGPRDPAARTALGRELVHLAGPDHVVERLGPFELLLSPSSFSQVNPAAAALLYRLAAQQLAAARGDAVLDLCSGSGALTFHLAAGAGAVLGVERFHVAVRDAQRSAAHNRIANAAFRAGRAAVIARRLFLKRQRFALAAANPPRTGMEAELPGLLPRLGVRRLCYVSCSPATLVRDLGRLAGHGFRLLRLWPFDLFPQTYHLEVLAVLER